MSTNFSLQGWDDVSSDWQGTVGSTARVTTVLGVTTAQTETG